jgi:hypothetical protein
MGLTAPLTGSEAPDREGEFAALDPTLKRLLGREPMSVRDWRETKRLSTPDDVVSLQ